MLRYYFSLAFGLIFVGIFCGSGNATDCFKQPTDIVFLLDASASVGSRNFHNLKLFVEKIVQTFDLGPGSVQVGFATFASTPWIVFDLNSYHDQSSLISAIEKTGYHTGHSVLYTALRKVRKQMFTSFHGDRSNARNMLVVFTDGRIDNRHRVAQEAEYLRRNNIQVVAVGLGNSVDISELETIATDHNHVISVMDLQTMLSTSVFPSFMRRLNDSICQRVDGGWSLFSPYSRCTTSCGGGFRQRHRVCNNPVPANGGSPCPGTSTETIVCNVHACSVTTTISDCSTETGDVVFLLDSSGSLGSIYFNKVKQLVSEIIQGFEIGPGRMQVGIATFSNSTHNQYSLSGYQDKQAILNAISNIGYIGGPTHTSTALRFARQVMFTRAEGDRNNARDMLVVVTDGMSSSTKVTLSEATELQRKNITVLTVGIGPHVNQNELQGIATDPGHVFNVGTTSYLNSQLFRHSFSMMLLNAICPTVDGGWTSFVQDSLCSKICGGGTEIWSRQCTNPSPANGGAFCKGNSQHTRACNTQSCPTTTTTSTTTTTTTTTIATPIPTTSTTKPTTTPTVTTTPLTTTAIPTASTTSDLTTIFASTMTSTENQKTLCVDESPDCAAFDMPENCGSYGNWARTNCRKSCDLCEDVCVFNGTVYTQDEVWHDGCLYRCQCTNASAGLYTCDSRCRPYSVSDPHCQLIPDPGDSCCMMLDCNGGTTPVHLYTQTVPNPIHESCKYKGQNYGQGESWHDGCGMSCRCEDAMIGFYQCTNRCPVYNAPTGCSMVQDSNDSVCCTVPGCPDQWMMTHGLKGSIVSFVRPSNTDPYMLSRKGYANACVYKGRIYHQGSTWFDGCDYQCECLDSQKGVYNCTQRCPQYFNVPTGCNMTQDVNDACCQVITCSQPTIQCVDKSPSCSSLAPLICNGNLQQWAIDNCAKSCSFCA